MEKAYRLSEEELRAYCLVLLKKIALSEEDADVLTDTTVAAELRGVASHGVMRLQHYIDRMSCGLINLRPKIKVEKKTESVLLIDADNGLGQVAAKRGMTIAIEKARDKGICCVGIRNTNHIGMAGYYAEMAAHEQMAGFITANTNPAMAPWGGVKALLGTNPFAAAVPTRGKPILLDMATTNVARGKIRLFAEQNKQIPPGWAKDESGLDTQDPNRALQGTLYPVGGAKGYGMALLIDIIAGIITGSKCSDELCSLNDMTRPVDSGNFIMVFDIKSMIEYSFYLDRLEDLKDKIKKSPKAGEVQEIFLAGEPEYSLEEIQKRDGVKVSREMWQTVKKVLQENEQGGGLHEIPDKD